MYCSETFKRLAKDKDYVVFENTRPYNLNIWGVRSDNQKAGKFDDKLFIWTDDLFEEFTVTVDPSDLYLLNPINPLGTAIIKPGQYLGLWAKGYHKGRENHPALVQRNPIVVIRDFNRDAKLDFNPIDDADEIHIEGDVSNYYLDQELVYRTHLGYFGINCHRANKYKILELVGLHSAGCVVHQDPFRYEKEFLPLIDKAINIWGNSFTFTLITEKELKGYINDK